MQYKIYYLQALKQGQTPFEKKCWIYIKPGQLEFNIYMCKLYLVSLQMLEK